MRNIPDRYKTYFICSALALATLAVFWQVHNFDFINYDDDVYVSANKHISTGFVFSNIIWAFKKAHFFMWHPMTSISHMLDCELFGLRSGWHHIINLLFHIANTLLLFTVLKRMTDRIWSSAFVAAVFALHSMNVESVAWIAERKSVLSGFFWMLTIVAYVRYAKRPRLSNYLLVIFVFALALMSKPTTVTLPFVLLLLDYWPLGRFQWNVRDKNKRLPQLSSSSVNCEKLSMWQLIREKIPLLILSAGLCVITVATQQSGDVLKLNKLLPFTVRLANALVSYVTYIYKMIWPSKLAVFYPHPGYSLPTDQLAASVVILAVISITVICLANRKAYLVVGWFWFLGTLVPMIGVMQAGSQAMADRYAYIPLIGLFIIVAWGANDLLADWKYGKVTLGVLSITVVLVLSVCTWVQTGYWRNSQSLFEHALQVTQHNSTAHYNLAIALAEKGKFEEAAEHCRIAIQLRTVPPAEMLHYMGSIYNNLGHYAEAVEVYGQAIKIDPNYADAYVGLANILGKLGRHAEAEQACKLAIKIKPDSAEAYAMLGAAYFSQGYWTQAVEASRRAISLDPDYAQAYYSLGMALFRSGDRNAALAQFEILKKLDPSKANTLLNNISK